MKRAAAWSVRGVERETQEIVEEAARRAGMSLPDWLDEVVAAYAASRGVRIEDMSQDERLDAIANRISLLSMREIASRRARRGF